MSHVPPKGRKHLSADALFRLVHTGFAHIPDYRPAEADISLPDVLMSACAMFSLKAPSLLAFDKERAEGNVHTIYGIQRVPCDTYMREILDPIAPFAQVLMEASHVQVMHTAGILLDADGMGTELPMRGLFNTQAALFHKAASS